MLASAAKRLSPPVHLDPKPRSRAAFGLAAAFFAGGAGLAGPGATAATAASTTIYVTSAGTGTCSSNSAANGLPTIAGAVACALSGDTISVGPGTFHGGVTLGPGELTLEGAGAAETTIEDTSVLAGAAGTPEVTIAPGADVTVKDLTVDGGNINSGIDGTTGTLSVDAVDVLHTNTFFGVGHDSFGAIAMEPGSTGVADLAVTNSTVADNQDPNQGIGDSGVTVRSTGPQPSQATLVNDTITTSGNTEPTYGAAVILFGANATLVNDTIDANRGELESGGLFAGYTAGGTATHVSVANTLIAANTVVNSGVSVPFDCVQFEPGVIVNGGHNLLGADTTSSTGGASSDGYGCGLGNGAGGTYTTLSSALGSGPTTSLPVATLQQAIPAGASLSLGSQTVTTTQATPAGATSVSVQSFTPSGEGQGTMVVYELPVDLGPLAQNGGPTETQALLKGSPAIGTGDATICNSAPANGLDQRGDPRNATSRGVCDIGAYDTGGTASGSPVAVGTKALPDATVGLAYSASLTATAGTMPYTWSLIDGTSLPSGLTMDATTGAIGGTPKTAGTTDFTVQVTDSTEPVHGTATAQLSITVAPAPPSVSSLSPTSGSASGHRYIEIFGSNLSPNGTTCLWYKGAGCSGVAVYVGANKAFVIYASPTIILVLSPPGVPGTVDITVQVDGQASSVTSGSKYTYV